MSPSQRRSDGVPPTSGVPGADPLAPTASWAQSTGVVFFDPATDTSPYAAKHKKAKDRYPAKKPSVAPSARSAAARAAAWASRPAQEQAPAGAPRQAEQPARAPEPRRAPARPDQRRPAARGASASADGSPQRRGPLQIVSDDPVEIRRYAEAQRLSATGALPVTTPPAPQETPGAPIDQPLSAVEPPDAASVHTEVPDPADAPTEPTLAKARRAILRRASSEHLWRAAMVWITAAACVFVTVAMLYFPAQELYLAVRQNERLVDELDQNLARNELMQERVASLQTAEGVQDEARLYDLVMPGEHAVTVVGAPYEAPASSIPIEIRRGSGQNTSSWGTDLLDRVFGVVGTTGASVAEAGDVATVVEEAETPANPDADIVAQGDEAPEQP